MSMIVVKLLEFISNFEYYIIHINNKKVICVLFFNNTQEVILDPVTFCSRIRREPDPFFGFGTGTGSWNIPIRRN